MSDPKTYRADIDGLRAIAVIAVVLFHVGFERFTRGYLGVDIFFVISGFLITRIIVDEVLTTNAFSFGKFYARRARRLFPALFVTLLICFVVASALLSPQHFQRFAGALVHAVMSISNIYFWAEAGYFDTDSILKPLLHTWSLSVEEQFYLVWPLTLVLLLTRAREWVVPIALISLGVASYCAGQWFIDASKESAAASTMLSRLFSEGASSAFYLMPFRVFEFSIGAVMVWITRFQLARNWLRELLLLLGLALVSYAVVGEHNHPTMLTALMLCLGSALMIYSGTARYLGLLLRNRLIVGIGLVSYSLYLVHWPIIVFYRYWKFGDLDFDERIAICVASAAVAGLMYRFVEQPFRRTSPSRVRYSNPAFGLTCALLALLITLPAASAWANGGWLWRFTTPQSAILSSQLAEDIVNFRKFVSAAPGKAVKAYSSNRNTKVLVVGDSQGEDFLNVLHPFSGPDTFEVGFLKTRRACQSVIGLEPSEYDQHIAESWRERCYVYHQAMNDSELVRQADVIIFSGSWAGWGIEIFHRAVLDHLKATNPNARLLVLGPKTQNLDGLAFSARFFMLTPEQAMDKYKPYLHYWDLESVFKQRADPRYRYVSLYDLLCEAQHRCRVLSPEGGAIMYDNNHLTPHGASYVGAELARSGFFEQLRQ